MTRVRGLLGFLVAFVIGEDPRIAIGVAVGVVLALILHAWEIPLVTALVLLALSTVGAARQGS